MKNTIDALALKKAFIAGANNLDNKKDYINELNVFLPVCIYNFLQSARLLAASIASFDERCVSGIRANREKMAENMERSLMLVTALTPHIGFELILPRIMRRTEITAFDG